MERTEVDRRFRGLLVAWSLVALAACDGTEERWGSADGQVSPRTEGGGDAPAPDAVALGVEAPGPAPAGMVWIPGGRYALGSDDPFAAPFERPVHDVSVHGFWIDTHEVTNAEFLRFVTETGYVTTAERPIDVEQIRAQLPPGTPMPPPEQLQPGSLVFRELDPDEPAKHLDWWKWTAGACWKRPQGPGSTLDGLMDHPVVHVSWDDAVAYAKWAGKRLPTEAEWEIAARGGLVQQSYTWGDDRFPGGPAPANIWQGRFPFGNTREDGFVGTSPVGSYAPNGYGLYDMSGNVWEWCADWYSVRAYEERGPHALDPRGPIRSDDPTQPFTPVRVVRGGSFLCNDSYCRGYRPSARMRSSADTGLGHTGFRCVKDA